jgi:hypothetical protein
MLRQFVNSELEVKSKQTIVTIIETDLQPVLSIEVGLQHGTSCEADIQPVPKFEAALKPGIFRGLLRRTTGNLKPRQPFSWHKS